MFVWLCCALVCGWLYPKPKRPDILLYQAVENLLYQAEETLLYQAVETLHVFSKPNRQQIIFDTANTLTSLRVELKPFILRIRLTFELQLVGWLQIKAQLISLLSGLWPRFRIRQARAWVVSVRYHSDAYFIMVGLGLMTNPADHADPLQVRSRRVSPEIYWGAIIKVAWVVVDGNHAVMIQTVSHRRMYSCAISCGWLTCLCVAAFQTRLQSWILPTVSCRPTTSACSTNYI